MIEYYDEGSRLEAATRAAIRQIRRLESSKTPVPTNKWKEARAALERARKAEHAYWNGESSR